MKTYKTYALNRQASQYSLQVKVGDDTRFIIFRNIGFGSLYSSGAPQYQTADKEVQEGIEASNAFKTGKVLLKREVSATTESAPKNIEPKVDNGSPSDIADMVTYDEVTKFREAQDILTSPPYNVPKTSQEITSKERVHAKAAELGISFPNLK